LFWLKKIGLTDELVNQEKHRCLAQMLKLTVLWYLSFQAIVKDSIDAVSALLGKDMAYFNQSTLVL